MAKGQPIVDGHCGGGPDTEVGNVGSDILIQRTGSSHSLPNAVPHGARCFGSSFLGIWRIPQLLVLVHWMLVCSTLVTSMQPGLCILTSKLKHSPASLLSAGFMWKSEGFTCCEFAGLEHQKTKSSL